MVTDKERLLRIDDIKTMRKDIKMLKKDSFSKKDNKPVAVPQIKKEVVIEKPKVVERVIQSTPNAPNTQSQIKVPITQIKIEPKVEPNLPKENLEKKVFQEDIAKSNSQISNLYKKPETLSVNKNVPVNNVQNQVKLKDQYREKLDDIYSKSEDGSSNEKSSDKIISNPKPQIDLEKLRNIGRKKSFLEEVEDWINRPTA